VLDCIRLRPVNADYIGWTEPYIIKPNKYEWHLKSNITPFLFKSFLKFELGEGK
jgi:hypothetical protein